MDRFMTRSRAQGKQVSKSLEGGREETAESPLEISGMNSNGSARGGRSPLPSNPEPKENPLPFMGMKVRRRVFLRSEFQGDYVGVPSDPYLSKILRKQGDGKILFADKIMRFTGTGKIRSRILLITDLAIYLIDPDSDILKRRILLAAVDKLRTSELNDNFFAIIIPTQYDCLIASTRKTEIIDVLLEVTKNTSQYELEIFRSNRFEYNAAADMVKEVEFVEVDESNGCCPIIHVMFAKPNIWLRKHRTLNQEAFGQSSAKKKSRDMLCMPAKYSKPSCHSFHKRCLL